MRPTEKFESIYASCRTSNEAVLYLDGYLEDEFDFAHDNCLVRCSINFYGIPSGLSDEKMENVFGGNYSDVLKIGLLIGHSLSGESRKLNRSGGC